MDLYIGMEGSILRDIGSMFSIKLPMRMALLLADHCKYNSEFIYDYAELTYEVRNSVVHSDESLEKILQSKRDSGELEASALPSELDKVEYRNLSRYFLSRIILEYSRIEDNHDENIDGYNKDYLRPRLSSLLRQLPKLED